MVQDVKKFCHEKFTDLLPRFRSGELAEQQLRDEFSEAVKKEFSVSQSVAMFVYDLVLTDRSLMDPKSIEGLTPDSGITIIVIE
jgi:hypothetical protein